MSERTPRFLWMEVSKDEYELPLAVADSALELAKVLGLKDENSVISFHAPNARVQHHDVFYQTL